MDPEIPLKQRTQPMQVIVLGLCRTGTSSMKAALQQLGFENVYHMDVINNDPTHRQLWEKALWAKYDEETPKKMGRAQFDHLLGEYNAACDIPACLFPEEIIEAYPEAKIILTSRDPDRWFKSMKETVMKNDPWRDLGAWLHLPGFPATASAMTVNVFFNDFDRYGKRAMREHNELVRRIAPPQRFLDFNASQGWEPLCEFLEKNVPEVGYPHANDTATFQTMVAKSWRNEVVKEIGKLLLASTPVIAVGCVVWVKHLKR